MSPRGPRPRRGSFAEGQAARPLRDCAPREVLLDGFGWFRVGVRRQPSDMLHAACLVPCRRRSAARSGQAVDTAQRQHRNRLERVAEGGGGTHQQHSAGGGADDLAAPLRELLRVPW